MKRVAWYAAVLGVLLSNQAGAITASNGVDNSLAPSNATIPNWETGWGNLNGTSGWEYNTAYPGNLNAYGGGTYLGGDWFINVLHAGTGTQVEVPLQGGGTGTYNIVGGSFVSLNPSGTDLQMFKVAAGSLDLPPIRIPSYAATPASSTQTGDVVAMIRYGGAAGAGTHRWGANTLRSTSNNQLAYNWNTTFSNNGVITTNYYQTATGDSGTSLFIYNPSAGAWELAGLHALSGGYGPSLATYALEVYGVMGVPFVWGIGGVTADYSGTWAGSATWINVMGGGSATWIDNYYAAAQFGMGMGGTKPYTVTLGGSPYVSKVVFQDQAYTLTANTLNLQRASTSSEAPTITVNAANATLNCGLAGTGGLVKNGMGILTMNSTASTNLTGGLSLNAGTLLLDYYRPGILTNMIDGTNALAPGGGTLVIRGNGITSQTLANLTTVAGTASKILLNPNGGTSTTLNLGTLALANGSTMVVGKTAGAGTGTAAITTGSSTSFQNGGGRLLYSSDGGTTVDFVTKSGSSVAAFTAYTALPASGASNSTAYSLTGSKTIAAAMTPGVVKIIDNGVGQSLDLGGAIFTNHGGALFSGAHGYEIKGGTMIGANNNGVGDIVLHQYNTGGLVVSARIADTANSARSMLTKAGPGKLTLSGANSYSGTTYINEGVLSIGAIGTGGTTKSVTTTAGSATATLASGDTSGLVVGQTVSHPGIPLGTTVAAINGATQFTLSSGTGVTAQTAQTGVFGTLSPIGILKSLYFGRGTLEFTGAAGSTDCGVTISPDGQATFDVIGSNILTITSAVPATTGGLSKGGSGTLKLTGANAYTGTTTLDAGTLVAGSRKALGDYWAKLLLNGGILDLAVDAGGIKSHDTTVRGNVTILSNRATSGAGAAQLLGTLSIGSSTLSLAPGANVSVDSTTDVTFTYATRLTGNPTFDIANNGVGATTLTVGPLDDGGIERAVTIQNNGTMLLPYPSKVLTSGTAIYVNDSSTLSLESTKSLGTGIVALNIASGAKVNLNFVGTTTVASLKINGNQMAAGTYGSTANLAGTGTVTVLYGPSASNTAPVIAQGASVNVTMSQDGSPTAFSLTLNASDADADTLTWSLGTVAQHGIAAASGTGTSKVIGYTPAAGYSGSDSFMVAVSDGNGATTTITVNVTILAANVAPVITEVGPLSVTMNEDSYPTAFSLNLHATDSNGDTLTWSIITAANNGTASASGTGASKAIGYTPNANYNGADNFTVMVSDGNGGTATILVNVTIQAVNDAPVANAQSVSATAGLAQTITLTGSDVENSPLTYTVVTTPGHGSLTGTAPNLLYTATTGFAGPDSFTFSVNDGLLSSAAATVTITVALPNGNAAWNVDADGTWNTPGNWNPAAVPGGPGTTIALANNISAARTVTLDTTPATVGILNLGDTNTTHAFTLAASGGAALTFFNGAAAAQLNQSSTSKGDTISAPIVLGSALAITNSVTANPLVLSGDISGSGFGLTKTGTGPLTLSGNNSFTGGVTLTTGVVNINSPGALGTGTFAMNTAGGTKTAGFNNTSGGPVVLSTNPPITWKGVLAQTISNSIDFGTGPVTLLNASCTVLPNNAATVVKFGGVISGAGYGIATGGAGTLWLTGKNTYNGTTGFYNISASPVIRADDGVGLPTASLLQFGIFSVFETGKDIVRAGGSGSGQMNMAYGGNTPQINGFSAFGGPVNACFGTLASPTALTWGTSPFNPGIFILNYTNANNTLDFKNPIDLGASSRTVEVDAADPNAISTMSGALSGSSGGITKIGVGTLVLGNASNNYAGAVLIKNGTLRTASIKSVNGGVSPLGAPTTVAAGTIAVGDLTTTGVLAYSGSGDITDRVINLSGNTGGATLDQSGSGLLQFTSALTATGLGSKTLTLQGATAGTGELAGTIVDNANGGITTTTSNYSAGATTLVLDSVTGITTGTTIAGNNIPAGTTIILVDSPNRKVTLSAATTATGTTNAGQTLTLSNGSWANPTAVTKAGSGTWTLSGSNTYSGATSVTAGVLVIAKATALGSGALAIGTGVKLQLNYTGTRQVAALTLNGVAKPNGTYGSTASPAPNMTDAYFAGTGMVTVGPLPPGFTGWANDPAQGLTTGGNNGPLDDPDHDGISNMLEFVLGGAPLTASSAILPVMTPGVTGYRFEYDRGHLSLPPATTQVVQYGSDLTGWSQIVIPSASAGSVTITPGSTSDHVSVMLPNLGAMGFVRLQVSQ
ncbi:MAG: Ig-like domain-containing protein [Verrucomicrobiota bacterium]